jgi:mannose-6-phosphate isomerase-like protein (cupin superfamily)
MTERIPAAKNVAAVKRGFAVLQTTRRSQTAVMRLDPGGASGPKGNEHAPSEQILLVIRGTVLAEIGRKRWRLREGDAVVVPPGVDHRFSNAGRSLAVTFNVYSPPAYEA